MLALARLIYVVAAGVPVTLAAVSWTQFEDPAEHAFSLQIPAGWKVVGGLYRFGPLDPRVMVDLVSPDGGTRIRCRLPVGR